MCDAVFIVERHDNMRINEAHIRKVFKDFSSAFQYVENSFSYELSIRPEGVLFSGNEETDDHVTMGIYEDIELKNFGEIKAHYITWTIDRTIVE